MNKEERMELAYRDGLVIAGKARLREWTPKGRLVRVTPWTPNIIVNVGLDYIVNTSFLVSSPAAGVFNGLTSATPTVAAGDTMASHAGWTEVHTAYSQGTRPTYSAANTGTGVVSNTASPATYSWTGTGVDIGGAFTTTNSTKGGTTGTLISVVAFTGGNVTPASGNTVELDYDYTLADT